MDTSKDKRSLGERDAQLLQWMRQKIDLMREKEIKALTDLVRDLTERIAQLTPR